MGVELIVWGKTGEQWEMARNINSPATRVNISMCVNWMIYWTAYRQENISHELITRQYLQCKPPFHWGAVNNSAGSSHTSHTGNLSNSADSWCTGGMTHFHMAPSIQMWTPKKFRKWKVCIIPEKKSPCHKIENITRYKYWYIITWYSMVLWGMIPQSPVPGYQQFRVRDGGSISPQNTDNHPPDYMSWLTRPQWKYIKNVSVCTVYTLLLYPTNMVKCKYINFPYKFSVFPT